MVETITPVVHGGRGKWIGALGLHIAGATLTAGLFGATLGTVGGLLGAPFGRAGLVLVAVLAALYGLGAVSRFDVIVPQLRRQVPDWWRTFFSLPVTSFLYGAGLGIGFLTFMATGGLVTVAVAAAASGSPWLGMIVVAPFGFARGFSAAVASGVRTEDDGRRLVERLAGRSDRARGAANGMALAAVAALTLAAMPGSTTAGWGDLASGVLAVAFAWAAVSKLTVWRRWRRTLAAHRLPMAERFATWSVPLSEAAVPLLALLGLRTASSAWGLLLLAVFSAEVVRVRIAVGPAVPCGCFGGRSAVDAGTLLARNAGLAVVGLAGVVGAHDLPLVRWPGAPGQGEILPMVLASVGVLVAGFAAWQAALWLGRRT